jgi:hypothetical protein
MLLTNNHYDGLRILGFWVRPQEQPARRDTRLDRTCPVSTTSTVVLPACCKERSIAVTYGGSRCQPSAGQRVSPGTVARFPSS